MHVADLPATELGGSRIILFDDHYVTDAATSLPSPASRYPLVPPANIKNRKRPWDKIVTDTMHGELQSTTDYLPIGPVEPAAVAAGPPIQIEASNAVELSNRIPDTTVKGR